MEHPLIQSVKAMDTRFVDKATKNELVSKEQFEACLSKETNKQLTEKEANFKPEQKINEDQDEPIGKEGDQVSDFLFSSSILTVQDDLSCALKLNVPKDQTEKMQETPMESMEMINETGIENGLEQTLPVQKELFKKAIETNPLPIENTEKEDSIIPFAIETNPLPIENAEKEDSIIPFTKGTVLNMNANKQVNLTTSVAVLEFDKEGSNQLLEPVLSSNENKVDVNGSKEAVNTNGFDKLTTPRLLTREWIQVKKPTEIEQMPLSETKDSALLTNQPDSHSIDVSKDSLVGNEKLAIAVPLDENEQLLLKREDGESTIKVDGSVAIQKNTAEPIGIKVNSQDTIKQKFTHEVNQLISKEIEKIQLKGQSSAKVTISPEGMGDISISLELKDHVLSTRIMVDSLKIQELLTGGVPKLSDNLNRHSIQIGEISIQLATADQNGSHFDQRQHKRELQAKINKIKGSFVESTPIKTVPEANGESGRLSILV